MYNAFVNPWNFIAGAALISVPIIIHLINRLRYKRVAWAAMEFLLKAQRRMKRKLVMQQLLLLFLRCLLVFLLGLMAARFLGFSSGSRETRPTQHLVIIDDTPSMADSYTDDKGVSRTPLETCQAVLGKQILPAVMMANNPQHLSLLKLSKPFPEPESKTDVWQSFDQIGEGTEKKIDDWFKTVSPQSPRGRLQEALKSAKDRINEARKGRDQAFIIHILSDFRTIDWETDGPAIRDQVRELTEQQVKVHLTDVASPYRKDDATEGEVPAASENVAITGLRPLQSMVPKDTTAEFVLNVKNFGVADVKNLSFRISVNGIEKPEATVFITSLASMREEPVHFKVTINGFADKKPYTEMAPYCLVSVRLTGSEPGGLVIDNVRHTLIEVRDTLKILAIDGKPNDVDSPTSDSYLLHQIFTSTRRGFEWKNGSVDMLKGDLRPYSCIFLLNVPSLDADIAAKLEKYVADGGGVGIFLGPDVKAASYNDLLYKDGKGLMPGRLQSDPSKRMEDLEANARRARGAGQFVLRDMKAAKHDTLYNIYYNERGLEDSSTHEMMQPMINRSIIRAYWPMERDTAYVTNPLIQELYCFPNERTIDQYTDKVLSVMRDLKYDKPAFEDAKPALDAAKAAIEDLATTTRPLPLLANALDRLLRDSLSYNDKAEKPLREFWKHPDNKAIEARLKALRDEVKFGDPIYVARRFGLGRVTVVTTTAGTGTPKEGWNDWATGMGGGFYRVIIEYMQQYLAGGGTDEDYHPGEPVIRNLDREKYDDTYNLRKVPVTLKTDARREAQLAASPLEQSDKKKLDTANNAFRLSDTQVTEPGAYFYTLWRKAVGDVPAAAEIFPVAVTIDAMREGDLRRMPKNDLSVLAPGAELHSAGNDKWTKDLRNRRRDATEAGWIFLLLLAILVGEQALATALSRNSATAGPAAMNSPAKLPVVITPEPARANAGQLT